MAVEKELVDIERKLWTNDAVAYQNRLAEEAPLGFSETGVITRDIAVRAILNENTEGRKWAEVEFDAVRSLPVTRDVVLLSYSVVGRWEHEKTRISALASSLYVKRDGVWKLAFHQQTPVKESSGEVQG